MSFSDLIQASQAIALADRLNPTEVTIWKKICREYSKMFSTPLHMVQEMDPQHVLEEFYSERFSSWDVEESIDDILDTIGSLSDPDYDIKRERAFREEMRQIVEEDRARVESGRAVHESLEPKDKKLAIGKKPAAKKELPTQGGINMDLVRQLQNDETESGNF